MLCRYSVVVKLLFNALTFKVIVCPPPPPIATMFLRLCNVLLSSISWSSLSCPLPAHMHVWHLECTREGAPPHMWHLEFTREGALPHMWHLEFTSGESSPTHVAFRIYKGRELCNTWWQWNGNLQESLKNLPHRHTHTCWLHDCANSSHKECMLLCSVAFMTTQWTILLTFSVSMEIIA